MGTVFVTGTSSGIGLATAHVLARAGHTVIAGMRNPDPDGELAHLVSQEQLPVTMVALDVDNDELVSEPFKSAISQHGPIDALVNNAGITQPGTIEETPLDSFRAMMETNYFGVLRCIKAVLPHMRARRAGCIVNISSVAGRIALAPQAGYVASKHALEAMSECLAQEVRAFNIRVALVEPGIVATPIFKKIRSPETAYPQGRRLSAFFAALAKEPTPPEAGCRAGARDHRREQLAASISGWSSRADCAGMACPNQRRGMDRNARRQRRGLGRTDQAGVWHRFGSLNGDGRNHSDPAM